MITFILNMEPRSHGGHDQFQKLELGMLFVKGRVKQLKLNHVFKIYHRSAPKYLCSHFQKLSDTHRFNTRGSSTNFLVPKIRVNMQYYFLQWQSRLKINYQSTSKVCKARFNSKRPSKAFFYYLRQQFDTFLQSNHHYYMCNTILFLCL